MRASKARAGRRAGQACHRRWSAYGKLQGKGRRRGSPRSSTTSASTLLEAAFFELKENAAAGVDGLTWRDYEAGPRAQARGPACAGSPGSVSATAVAAGLHSQAGRRQRPLAVAALEDKIVQRATVAVLNAIYEEDFLGFSYGFRPGRGAHDAMDALVVGIEQQEGELDTGRRYPIVLRYGEPAMADPLRRAPDRRPAHHPPDPEMAKAGVLEDGIVSVSEKGTGRAR